MKLVLMDALFCLSLSFCVYFDAFETASKHRSGVSSGLPQENRAFVCVGK